MSIIEIVLIIVGIIIFALGYLLPAKKRDVDEEVQLIGEDEVRKLVAQEVEGAKEHISDIVEETVTYAMEKTERSMERVTNEKIMAVNEYSDTVLEEINKNHKEVLFLYDMLNDKHENLKNTVSEAAKTAEEVKQTVKDAEITAREAEETVKNAIDTVLDAVENVPEQVAEVHDMAGYDAMLVDEVQQMAEEEQPEDVPEQAITTIETLEEEPEELLIDMPETLEAVEETIETAGGMETEQSLAEIEEPMPEITEQTAEIMEMMKEAEEEISSKETVEDEFVPIAPPRVEIIHNPDGEYDYVADAAVTADEIAELLKPEEPAAKKKTKTRKTTKKTEPKEKASETKTKTSESKAKSSAAKQKTSAAKTKAADTKTVDIQFANGKDNSKNSNERILELHKAGKSNMAIAKELGLGIGEVKLVIDLFEGL